MKITLLITGILAAALGFLQVFHPSILINIDKFIEKLKNKEKLNKIFRLISGIILILLSLILFYLFINYENYIYL